MSNFYIYNSRSFINAGSQLVLEIQDGVDLRLILYTTFLIDDNNNNIILNAFIVRNNLL